MRSQAVLVVLAMLVLVVSSLPLDGPRTEDLLDTTQLPDTGVEVIRVKRHLGPSSHQANLETQERALNQCSGQNNDLKATLIKLCKICQNDFEDCRYVCEKASPLLSQ